MGAYDLRFDVPHTITGINSMLGGYGQARLGVGAQQAQLDQNRYNTEASAWQGAIQQGTQALSRFAIAPFIPQLSQLAKDNPAAAMMAGNLLGLPGLTQAGQMQAGFGYDTQLQAQGIAGRGQLYQEEFNRNYQQAYQFSPQDAPMVGQNIYDSLPPSEQSMLLSGTGYNPQTLSAAPQQVQQSVMRRIAEGQARIHGGMQMAAGNVQIQDFADTIGVAQGLQAGEYEVDPDWQQELSQIKQGIVQTQQDPNLQGTTPQSKLMQGGMGALYDFARRAKAAGAITPKVDPIQQLGQTATTLGKYMADAGLRSMSFPMAKGQRGTLTRDTGGGELNTKDWTPQQYKVHAENMVQETPYGPIMIQPDGKGTWKSGGDDLDFGDVFKKVANPERDASVNIENTKKVLAAAQEIQQTERIRARTAATPIGKIVDALDIQSDAALERMGLPAWREMKDNEKRSVADYIWNDAQRKGQYAEALKTIQGVIGASQQAVGQKQQQILAKTATNPMTNPSPGTPIPGTQGGYGIVPGTENGPLKDPLSIKELDDAAPGTRGRNKRGVWATKQPDGTWLPDAPIKSRRR